MDPYILSNEKVLSPPENFIDKMKHLGPSMILSASIVGSGELIATTALGAKAGFTLFWLIIIGCFIKVMVQLEFGKHTILTGETAMQAFNKLPGPRIRNTGWSVWSVFIIMIIKLLQVGGIVGGVAIILHTGFPSIPVSVWALIIALIAALLIFQGYYKFIERFSIYMIAFFTLFTFTSLYFLKFTPFAITGAQFWSGLFFQLPKSSLVYAFGAFGITGVGGDEIIHYNYWCLEKGYASFTGPKSNDPEWEKRAKGWLKVMQLDAMCAMLIYTTVTAAFYLLGAAVLHPQGLLPEGYGIIEKLSEIFTGTLGEHARTFFYAGSFIVLFSTVFAALAAWTRQFTDIFGQIGWINFFDQKERQKTIAMMAWLIPFIWAILFIFIRLPLAMVMIGGIVGSVLLFIVVFAVFHFRYSRTPKAFKAGLTNDFLFLISTLSIISIGLYGLIQVF